MVLSYPEQVAAFLEQLVRLNPRAAIPPPNAGGLFHQHQHHDYSRQSVLSQDVQNGDGNYFSDDSQCSAERSWPWRTPDGRPCSQSKSFVTEDGKVDLDMGYREMKLRTQLGANQNFKCSPERFKALATENGQLTSKKMEEAIDVLQFESTGEIFNARRDPLAEQSDSLGYDFIAEDKNGETVFIEIKAPVSETIMKAEGQSMTLVEQSQVVGKKVYSQLTAERDSTKVSVPKDPSKVIVLLDLFNIEEVNKAGVSDDIVQTTKNEAVMDNNNPIPLNFRVIN